MLLVKRLDPRAKLPTCEHPGEDLGYDLYALEDVVLYDNTTTVRTGISARFSGLFENYGLLIRDRSSMAAKGLFTHGGVIDAGYTGEIKVILTSTSFYVVKAGDKIAQMIPVRVETWEPIKEVDKLPPSSREYNGFGSTGK